ncbi:TPA: hypothetical protein R4Y84_003090 [Klebsiella michiganensis]|nr:hypothetical protein [Klebsiella michiganensis]
MTDITELAQLRAEISNPAVGSKDHLRKIALSLVEALEKAQHEARVDWEAAASLNVENQELKRRIAELESRTVKMPEPFKLAKSSSGLTYYFADDVDAALIAAGIKWEGE